MPAVYVTEEQRRAAVLKRVLKHALCDSSENVTDTMKRAGINRRTYYKRLEEPGTMKLGELWKLLDELHVPVEERAKILE